MRSIALQLGVPSDRIAVIPNGVDLKSFYRIDRTEARLTLGISPDAKMILSVAQLIPRKGHVLLIQAVSRLCAKFPKLQLFIVGAGNLDEPLQRQITALGLERHVFLQGTVKNEELFRWYSAADATCLPSSREGLPCALVESLACGTPVVATAVGGIPELIDSQQLGILVQQDVTSISGGLEKALQTDWNRTMLTRHAGRYTWEQIAAEIDKVLVRSLKLNRELHIRADSRENKAIRCDADANP
jgi:glycosyltransferase involved in cell wall biosynthesis